MLNISKKLPLKDWLIADQTVSVMRALSVSGNDVRFVGGCIRDTLLKQKVSDIDIGTPDHPEVVINLLNKAGIKVFPTGIKHGTVTALVNNKFFEITSLRQDCEPDGRHAEVKFTRNWYEDAKRRDFTINSLSASPQGIIFDPFTGINDLFKGRVLFVGIPEDRIKEDYLRVLRFYRFSGLFSKSYPDNEATNACRKAAPHLANLSKERIRDELLKILLVDDPATISNWMKKDKIFDVILPEAKNITLLRLVSLGEKEIKKVLNVRPDPIRHLAALISPSQNTAYQIARRLNLSQLQTKQLTSICAPSFDIHPDMDWISEKKILHKLSPNLLIDMALLQWGREMVENPLLPRERKKQWIDFFKRCTSWSYPQFPITGKDVIALGISTGPTVGKLLGKVEDWWKNKGLIANRNECLIQLKKEITLASEDD